MTEEHSPATAAPAAPTPEPPQSAPPTAPPARKDRRVLWAALRWTTAVVVLAAVGTATAYGITRMERTDLPGLATESDGRWAYPKITKPPLPQGKPAPFAKENTANAHYADLRGLLLPAPEGATADRKLEGRDGFLAPKDFLAEFETDADRDDIRQALTDYGLRHIAPAAGPPRTAPTPASTSCVSTRPKPPTWSRNNTWPPSAHPATTCAGRPW